MKMIITNDCFYGIKNDNDDDDNNDDDDDNDYDDDYDADLYDNYDNDDYDDDNNDDNDDDDGLGQGKGKMTERQEDSGVPAGVSSLTCPREARILGDIAQAEQGSFVYFFLGIFFPQELLYMLNGIYYSAKNIDYASRPLSLICLFERKGSL